MKVFFLFLAACALFSAESIGGFWKAMDEETGKPRCVFGVYEYEGLYYGRIIGSYDAAGQMDDDIYKPSKRAPGVPGNPFYSGLDIIWYLADSGYQFKGKIMDPEHGKVYNAELWVENGNLIVRGKWLMFGRSQTWLPASSADFPKGFKMPDLKKMVPSVPNI